MFITARRTTALSALLLCLAATNALAVERASRVDVASCEKPEYPSRWQEEGDRGNVTVAVLLDADGKVLNSKLLSSSGYARVDKASVKAATTRCKFKPAIKDEKAVPTWAKIQYSWISE